MAKRERSLEDRLAEAKALVASLEKELELARADVQAGDDVTFRFGRADGARAMRGEVLAYADTQQGRILAIGVKDDLGLPEIKRVNIKAVTTNHTADARRAAESDPLSVA